VVLHKRSELGPALEPELVRVLGMLELQRRRLVRDRTQAIQRLRADWTQFDRVSEGREIAELLEEHGNPLADLRGAGTNLAATIIVQAGDVRRLRDAGRLRAALRSRADSLRLRPRPQAAIACTGVATRQLNAALYRIAIVQSRHHPQARVYLARKISEGKTPREAEGSSSGTSRTSSTGVFSPGPSRRRPCRLDIGESNASSRRGEWAHAGVYDSSTERTAALPN